MQLNWVIKSVNSDLKNALQQQIDQKTKPVGALGQLETVAMTIGLIQGTLTPRLTAPTIVIFAGDHGIAQAGVSAYPQTVTAQMVANFLAGGAAISVFARQHQLKLVIVDAGVNADLPEHRDLISAKIAKGTHNFLLQPAMSDAQCQAAIKEGAKLVTDLHQAGCNCIGFGEMGIGNTSSAALLVHCLAAIPLAQCVGRGTGLDDKQLQAKLELLTRAIDFHPHLADPITVLATFGGFEIAMMVGAYLQAAELGMVIVVDGFIGSAALLVAHAFNNHVLGYCLFSHLSSERGHHALLAHFKAKPLLNLGLRLGEGSGVALAYPIIQSAVAFLNEMASFAEAGVEQKIVNS